MSKGSTKTSSTTDGEPPEEHFTGPGRADCPVCHGMGYVREDVPVGHPHFGKMQPCTCRQTELADRRLAELRALSNLGALAACTFERFVPEGHGLTPDKRQNLRQAYERALAYAQSPQGWLVLRGGYGCGKTHLAAAIGHWRVEHGQMAIFVGVPDLLDYLRASFAPSSDMPYAERFELVRTAPLLILDDLGTESSTPWAQEKLYQIFNTRYMQRLPTVITTNHELEDIDPRLRSRMADQDVAQMVAITAPDYRGSGIEQRSELSSLTWHSDKTFESFDLRGEMPREQRDSLRRAFELARAYAENPEDWLVFQGPCGCGKTHLAAAIANYFQATRQKPVLFVMVPDLLDHLRATFSPQSPASYDQRFEEVRNAPLLVLDDLGTESATSWAREKLYQLFNHRYSARLPTVITTATPIDELDARLAARIADVSRCTLFAIQAGSYRGQPAPQRRRPPRRPK